MADNQAFDRNTNTLEDLNRNVLALIQVLQRGQGPAGTTPAAGGVGGALAPGAAAAPRSAPQQGDFWGKAGEASGVGVNMMRDVLGKSGFGAIGSITGGIAVGGVAGGVAAGASLVAQEIGRGRERARDWESAGRTAYVGAAPFSSKAEIAEDIRYAQEKKRLQQFQEQSGFDDAMDWASGSSSTSRKTRNMAAMQERKLDEQREDQLAVRRARARAKARIGPMSEHFTDEALDSKEFHAFEAKVADFELRKERRREHAERDIQGMVENHDRFIGKGMTGSTGPEYGDR